MPGIPAIRSCPSCGVPASKPPLCATRTRLTRTRLTRSRLPTVSMRFADLHSFIEQLQRDGDLAIIDAPVDPTLEVAEIHRRVIAAGGPALLFTHVAGASFPLVTNLFGTARRASLAFGDRPFELVRRAVHLAETLLPPTPAKLWAARDVLAQVPRIGTRRRPRGRVTEVVTDDVRLSSLPVITSWPDDGGPFITLPLVYTEHPDRQGHNLAMYRLHVHDDRHTGMHWQIGKGGGFHYQVAEARGEPLPVTVFLGGPPALILAAIAPLPENVPELVLASVIAGRSSAARRGPRPAPARRERRVRPGRPRAAARATRRRSVRRSLRLLLAAARVPGIRGAAPLPQARRDLPGDGRRASRARRTSSSATCSRTCSRRCSRLSCQASLDLWSYGETGYHSLASAIVRDRYPRRGHGLAPSASSARGSCR